MCICLLFLVSRQNKSSVITQPIQSNQNQAPNQHSNAGALPHAPLNPPIQHIPLYPPIPSIPPHPPLLAPKAHLSQTQNLELRKKLLEMNRHIKQVTCDQKDENGIL